MKDGIYTWPELNKWLRETNKNGTPKHSETDVQELLRTADVQRWSVRWRNRIYQRYSRLRKQRERRALRLPAKGNTDA